jgi:protein O-GlcNAc transferase
VNTANTPLVSIIVPCYNHAQFLSDAITSIVRQIYKNWECIIVNDGSTDNTGEVSRKIIAQYPGESIYLVERENGGLANARNTGVASSRGKYILPLDADDMIAPAMLYKCVTLLESNPEIAIAYSSIQQFGESRSIVHLREYDFHALCKINFMTCTALFRREAFDETGGYNENMRQGYEDWDFWIGCGERGFYGRHIPELLFFERIKDRSMYSTSSQHDKGLKAQIVLNHPSLFTQSQVFWAQGVIANNDDILSLPDISGIIPEFYDPPHSLPAVSAGKPLVASMNKDMQTAMRFYQQGNLRKAESIFRSVLRNHPDADRVNYELANVLYDSGQFLEAIAYYQKTLQLNPGLIGVYNDLGLAYQDSGLVDEAVKCYLKALLVAPQYADAYFNLGLAYEMKGHPEEAIQCYQKVIEANPNSEDALINLGNAYLRKRSFNEAITSYEKALLLNPNITEAYNNIGYALLEKKQYEESMIYFKRAIDISPDVAGTYFNLGNANKELHNFDEAIAHYSRALSINPNSPEIYLNLGYIYEYIGHNEDAITQYDKAFALDPDFFAARFARCMAQLKPIYGDPQSIQIARSNYRHELADLRNILSLETPLNIERAAGAVGSGQPFLLAYQGLEDCELQKDYGDLLCKIMSRKYPLFADRPPMPSFSEKEPVRVGIVSGYFYAHSNWKIPLKGWVENINRKRFSLYGYYTGDKNDQETQRARGYFAKFIDDVYSFEDLCHIIRNDKLHVLIYPEIGMDSTTVRLGTLRLAPVQCASWGHPDTSGLQTIDYYLSSDLMEPTDAEKHYTEQLIRLPHLSVNYTPLEIPITSVKRENFNLHPSSVLYFCSQSLSKYLPQYDEVFPRIAREDGAYQFIFIEDRSKFITEQFRSRLSVAFSKFNLDADRRVIFLPRLDQTHYHALNSLCDVYLDSIGWTGCNSTLEAIACNLPVVTLPGELMRGRHSFAILTMMGVTETIASTLDNYIALAVKLGNDSEWRQKVSEKTASRKHLLYRDMVCITALEDFLDKIVKERQTGNK